MQPKKAACTYLLTVVLLLCIMLVTGLITGAGQAIAWGFGPMSMIWVMALTFFGGRCGFLPSHNSEGDAQASNNIDSKSAPQVDEVVGTQPTSKTVTSSNGTDSKDSASTSTVSTASTSTSQTNDEEFQQEDKNVKSRLQWLDNAKSMLMCGVIMGHSGVLFVGPSPTLNFQHDMDNGFVPAAYTGLMLLKPLIVPMFFFISGFVTPGSLDRKGPEGYLKGNFLRLGIAHFVFWLMLNPMVVYLSHALAGVVDFYNYFPSGGHTWFLNWLLVFQCGYALIEGPVIEMELPSFCKLTRWTLGVAVAQLIASMMCLFAGSTLGFGEMPMTPGSGDGFFNVLLFAAGVVAKRNKWLEEPLPTKLVSCARIYTSIMVIVVPLIFFGAYLASWPLEGYVLIMLLMQLPIGPYCVSVIISVVDLFQRRCNYESAFTKFIARGSFAAYLFHYYFIEIYATTFLVVVEETQDLEIHFTNSTTADNQIGTGNSYGGFVYVALLSITSAFMFGNCVKRIPGLGQYL